MKLIQILFPFVALFSVNSEYQNCPPECDCYDKTFDCVAPESDIVSSADILDQCPQDVIGISLYSFKFNFSESLVFSRFHQLEYLYLENCNLNRSEALLTSKSFVNFGYVCDSSEQICQTEEQVKTIINQLPPQISSLRISSWRVKSINDLNLSRFTQLIVLDLSKNSLSTIGATNVFFGMGKLRALQLSFNKLTSLMPGVFNGLRALGSLDLSHNEIYSLEDGVFAHLNQLTELRLKGNNLTNVSSTNLTGLSPLSLVTIDFSDNNHFMPNWDMFKNLQRLSIISLSNCFTDVNPLPTNLFTGLHNIAALHLAGNRLTAIPASVQLMGSQFRTLDISHNLLTAINIKLNTQIPSTKSVTLDFSDNRISRVDSDSFIGSFHKISADVDLRRNLLQEIDMSAIKKLGRNVQLDARDNPIICGANLCALKWWSSQKMGGPILVDCIKQQKRRKRVDMSDLTDSQLGCLYPTFVKCINDKVRLHEKGRLHFTAKSSPAFIEFTDVLIIRGNKTEMVVERLEKSRIRISMYFDIVWGDFISSLGEVTVATAKVTASTEIENITYSATCTKSLLFSSVAAKMTWDYTMSILMTVLIINEISEYGS
ncbi:uncharacterized protein LOC141906953 [Tubulanus polymorphus]|uniref:uncharacterized protein LOC141906953 n=1 Tax=Tubulanus polymorphus TaxID=672921 RepID=UPI003DA3C4F0